MALTWVRDGYSLWAAKSEAAAKQYGEAHWTVGVNFEVGDAWFYALGCDVRFPSLADAQAWCETQERIAAAQPAAPLLPKPGSVWGVPGKLETRRFVLRVYGEVIRFCTIDGTGSNLSDRWQSWLRETGAVDLVADRERLVTEHEAAVNDLAWLWGWARRVGVIKEEARKLSEVVQTVAMAVDKDRALLVEEVTHWRTRCEQLERGSERLARELAELQTQLRTERGGADTAFRQLENGIEGLEAENAALQSQLLDKTNLAEAWRVSLSEEAARLTTERDDARATAARLMAALRGIDDVSNSQNGMDYMGRCGAMMRMAREAIKREEGVKS